MYFLLAGAKEKFHYLSHALGGILVFVGVKMTLSHWIHLNTYVSLAIILGMLAAAIVFSVRRNRFTLATAVTGLSDESDESDVSDGSNQAT
jgi:tellurite resistance protein TerC